MKRIEIQASGKTESGQVKRTGFFFNIGFEASSIELLDKAKEIAQKNLSLENIEFDMIAISSLDRNRSALE